MTAPAKTKGNLEALGNSLRIGHFLQPLFILENCEEISPLLFLCNLTYSVKEC